MSRAYILTAAYLLDQRKLFYDMTKSFILVSEAPLTDLEVDLLPDRLPHAVFCELLSMYLPAAHALLTASQLSWMRAEMLRSFIS